jgi:2-polyprenyl-3-methyl-5-hydroxy-6-metoxy-1,4-benzoquinol methylase
LGALEIMKTDTLARIRASYGRKRNVPDLLEYGARFFREKLLGFDYSIFEKTRRYYKEVHGEEVSPDEALGRALRKKDHKDAWYRTRRETVAEKMAFYQEVHVYPFRQPYNKRKGGFRWYRNLVAHVETPHILEYGCGSAVLTEYLLEKFPEARYTVADIPSVTLDFVKWKKKVYGYPYEILTIGAGRDGIPLRGAYDLIVCQDVLEHTPNPLDIVQAFARHLSRGGVLVLDFLRGSGGENLKEAQSQRDEVKRYLNQVLIPLKAIDENATNDGLYVHMKGETS